MKKKLLAALLSVSMVATVMTGCGEKEPAANSEAPVASSEAPAASSEAPASTEAASSEAASTEAASTEAASTEAATTEEAGGMAEPEELPAEAAYHFSMDGTDEGILTVIQSEDVGANTGATYGVVESATYIDKEGAEQPIVVQYADGPVGKCTYLDGHFGLKFPVEALETETYTISFWMNADRLSTYGPSLQLGSDMGMSDVAEEGNVVRWINFTQTEWGTSSAKIFPVVWNRNSATGAWPWVYAADDAIHGKKEWVMVTLVATGSIYNYAEEGIDRNACQLYLNGELAFDASEGAYGGLATDIMGASDNFECLFGINYWDSVFKGFVDELYIYKEALTPGQVASLYLLGNPAVESVAEAPAEVEAEPVAADHSDVTTTGTVVGATDCTSAFWGAHSDIWAVADGESKTVKFKNYSSTLNNWNNFVVILQNVAEGHSADDNADYAEYAVVRADNYGWGAGYDGIAVAECDYNWDTFTADLDRSDVEVTVSKDGATASVVAVVTTADGKTYTQSYTGIAAEGDLYFCLTVDGCFLDIQE